MKVFISWSGEKSKAAATALREWLPLVFQTLDPWMSKKDIDAGSRWSVEISDALQKTNLGIVCLTRQNLNAPWLHFECGALAKIVDQSYVVPYLLDLEPADIPQGPFTQFQAKRANKEETFELISSINALLPNKGLEDDQIRKTYEKWWGDLEKALNSLPIEDGAANKAKRGQDDKIDEILSIVRKLKIEHHSKRQPARTTGIEAAAPLSDVEKYYIDAQGSDLRRQGLSVPNAFYGNTPKKPRQGKSTYNAFDDNALIKNQRGPKEK